jgi:hypothetical protein
LASSFPPVGRVHDLRMEHQGVAPGVFVRRDRERRAFGGGNDLEPRGEAFDAVAVAHPHLVLLADMPQTVEQGRGRDDLDEGAPELLLVGGDDAAAQLLMKRLLAVADGEQREPAVEEHLRSARAVLPSDRCGSAGEDDALRPEALERFFSGVEGGDLAIDAGLADAARDELRHLAAEVDDEDGFGGLNRHGEPIESMSRLVKLSLYLSVLTPRSGMDT